MQMIPVSDLREHPMNDYLFDCITGAKWNDFLTSVRTSGVIEPIVVNTDMVIVSGHQRVRACKEIGIERVMCEIKHYDSEDAVLKDLIETNIRQRGVIDNTIKQGRIAKELERIYGIVDMKRPAKVQAKKELAQTLDCSYERMETYKRMADMNEDIQQAVLSGKIQPTVAAVELSRMTEGEQEQFAQLIPQKTEWSNAEVKEQARLIKKLRQENKDLEERLERAVINSDDDEADIEEFIQKIAELEQECRKEYERAEGYKKQLRIRETELEVSRAAEPKAYEPTAKDFSTCIVNYINGLEYFSDFLENAGGADAITYRKWLNEAIEASQAAFTKLQGLESVKLKVI